MRLFKTALAIAIIFSFSMCSNDPANVDGDITASVRLKTFNSCDDLGVIMTPFIEQKTSQETIQINPQLEPDPGGQVTAYHCKWEIPPSQGSVISDAETSVLGQPKVLIGFHSKQSYIDFLNTPPAQLENVDEFYIFEDERIPDNVLIWKWLNNDQYGYLDRLGYELLIFDENQVPYISKIDIRMENRFGPNVQNAPFVPADPGNDVALDILLQLIETTN